MRWMGLGGLPGARGRSANTRARAARAARMTDMSSGHTAQVPRSRPTRSVAPWSSLRGRAPAGPRPDRRRGADRRLRHHGGDVGGRLRRPPTGGHASRRRASRRVSDLPAGRRLVHRSSHRRRLEGRSPGGRRLRPAEPAGAGQPADRERAQSDRSLGALVDPRFRRDLRGAGGGRRGVCRPPGGARPRLDRGPGGCRRGCDHVAARGRRARDQHGDRAGPWSIGPIPTATTCSCTRSRG